MPSSMNRTTERYPTAPDRFLPTDVGRFGSDEGDAPQPKQREAAPPFSLDRHLDLLLTQCEVVRRAWAKKRRLAARTEQAAPRQEIDPATEPLGGLFLLLAKRLVAIGIDLSQRGIAVVTRLLTKRRRANA